MVIAKVLDVLGCFNEAKHIMTGGAVSSKKVIDFFFLHWDLDLPGIWPDRILRHGVG